MAGLAHPSGLVRRHERRGDFGHGSEMANECMMALLTVLTGMLDLIKQGFSCTGRWKGAPGRPADGERDFGTQGAC